MHTAVQHTREYASSNDKITAASLESENEFYTRKKIVLSVNVNFAIFSAISVHRKKKKRKKETTKFDEIKLTTSKYFVLFSIDSTRCPEQVYAPKYTGRTVLDENQSLIREFANFATKRYYSISGYYGYINNTGRRLFPRRDEILIVHHYRGTSRSSGRVEEGWKEWSA